MTGCRVVVIGGGASGLAAAVSATQNGAEVTVLEHKDRVGKKILMTGNGKCNLTNVSDYHGKYFSSDEKSLEKIYNTFECFGADKTIEFFENIGIASYNEITQENILNLLPKEVMDKYNVVVQVIDPVLDITDKKDIMKNVTVTLSYNVNGVEYSCTMQRIKVKE